MATSLVEEAVQGLDARIEELEAELTLAKEARAWYLPDEPSEEGTVIRFVKPNLSLQLAQSQGALIEAWHRSLASLAAIKAGDRWYITQDGACYAYDGWPAKTWNELLSWIGERNWHRIEVLS